MAQLSTQQVAMYARSAFGDDHVVMATTLARLESSFNTLALHTNTNGSTDKGLWQINTINADVLKFGDWRDPATNAKMAKAIYDRQGWSAWSTYQPTTQKFRDAFEKTNVELNGSAVPAEKLGALIRSGGKTANTADAPPPPSNPLDQLTDLGDVAKDAYRVASTPHFWVRVSYGVVGAALIVVAVSMISSKTQIGQAVIGGTKKVVTKGLA